MDQIITVTSNNSPSKGQKHRSSNNFSFSSDCGLYKVSCPDGVNFSLMEDISWAIDSTIYTNVKDGDIINNVSKMDLYIADPQVKSETGTFVVSFVPYVREWMTPLDDQKYLYQLSIPGTHDTGTYALSPGYAKCQNFSIEQQLSCGIRFLDIRLDENFQVCHGEGIFSFKCGFYFSDVLKTCNTFLELHPGEAILMSVKNEDGDMSGKMPAFFDHNQDLVSKVYLEESIPKLGEVRGRIVLFRRFAQPNNNDWGINIHNGWPDNGSGMFQNTYDRFYIQDRYFAPSELIHSTKEKKEQVETAIQYATGLIPNPSVEGFNDVTMYISFNSMSANIAAARTPWQYAWGLGILIDPIMNYVLSALLDDVKANAEAQKASKRVGVVLLDFYNKHGNDDDQHCVEKIIAFNN